MLAGDKFIKYVKGNELESQSINYISYLLSLHTTDNSYLSILLLPEEFSSDLQFFYAPRIEPEAPMILLYCDKFYILKNHVNIVF